MQFWRRLPATLAAVAAECAAAPATPAAAVGSTAAGDGTAQQQERDDRCTGNTLLVLRHDTCHGQAEVAAATRSQLCVRCCMLFCSSLMTPPDLCRKHPKKRWDSNFPLHATAGGGHCAFNKCFEQRKESETPFPYSPLWEAGVAFSEAHTVSRVLQQELRRFLCCRPLWEAGVSLVEARERVAWHEAMADPAEAPTDRLQARNTPCHFPPAKDHALSTSSGSRRLREAALESPSGCEPSGVELSGADLINWKHWFSGGN